MKNKIAKYTSIFLAGFLLMLSINFYLDWSFEEELLNNLANRIKSKSTSQDPESLILAAMQTATYMEERNAEIFNDSKFTSLKVKLMAPSFTVYNYGAGCCGGYTLFLARLLKKMQFTTKIVQLKVDGVWGGHIALAVENKNKLLLLDPYYNFAFQDTAGHLSDINDVAKNWSAYYSLHLPPNYKKQYNYQSGWRFTNWDKLGWLSRSAYKIGIFIFGKEKMDNVSVRSWFLGITKYYGILSFLGCLLITSFIITPYLRKKKIWITYFAKQNLSTAHFESVLKRRIITRA